MCCARARRRLGLAYRLNAWYAGVFALSFALAVLGAHLLAVSAVNGEQAALVAREVSQHKLQIEGNGLAGLAGFVAARRKASNLRWFVRISDAGGRTLLYDAPSADLNFDDEAMKPSEEPHTIVSRPPASPRPWRLTSIKVSDTLWLQFGVDDQPRRTLLARIAQGLWLLLGIGLALGLAGGLWVTRRALWPIRQLTETCQHIVDSADVAVRVPEPAADDELGHLSRLFNRVLARNQQLVEGMRQALDNVAHDLRTPLSRLRSAAELALSGERSNAALREALADCIEESERTVGMLRTLMDISEAETGVMALSRERVPLSRVVAEVVDLYQHVAEQRGLTLTSNLVADSTVSIDRVRLTRAVANLVDNALKYTDPPGCVELTLSRAGARALLRVRDTGVGIAPEHLDKIWQRLYRADSSRSRQGLGLGLSFVKAIVAAHGGSVEAHSAPGEGASFVIGLPIDAPASIPAAPVASR
jgi:signal transduction histidine kinase